MKLKNKISFLLILFLGFPFVSFSQERNWESYLNEDVENVNPVYMPVIGVGAGYFSFIGDIKNNTANPLMGSLAMKINVHAFIDGPKHYKFNIYSILTIPGAMQVTQRSYMIPDKNFRFQTDLFILGANAHYDFDHFIKKTAFVRPFISIGAELINFSSKADLYGDYQDASGNWVNDVRAYYWSDGSIRNRPQSDERPSYRVVFERKGKAAKYEVDMRSDTSMNPNRIKYSQNIPAIPIEAGLEFAISNRTTIRLGYSYHFTFTDYIDQSAPDIGPTPALKGKSGNDKLGYTYASLHFDLFSDPKMLRLSKLLAMVDDYDYALLDDEDYDGVLDINDHCLHTPKGQAVDTLGCPFDTDADGVADYLDKEQNTRPGAIVDRDGVEIPDALVWANLGQEALPRDQVEVYLSAMNNLGAGSGRRNGSIEIPEKFKALDLDKDGYISFDEVLKAIDAFFDFESDLSTQDIYDLNDFFFSQ